MKKFNFRLETVLQLRINNEQQKLLAQSRAQRLYQERRAAMAKTQTALEQTYDLDDGQAVNAQLHLAMYREHLKNLLDNQMHLTKIAEQKLNDARRQTMEARKERLVLEKLKERQFNDYCYQLNLAEAKFTDELATGMYNRRRQSRI